MMEKTSNDKTRKNKISAKETEERLVQLFGQEKPGKIEVTEEERKRYKKMKNLRALFGNLGRPDLEKQYEELDAKIKIADGKLPETDADNAEELESGEIPQDLKDFHKVWEGKIENIDNVSKEKIIKAAENIPVKVEMESDGSRLIEFELGNKTYKILDPKLKTHSDDEYFDNSEYEIIRERNEWVKLGGMRGDDVTKWGNKKLANYVKQKEKQGLHIPKIEKMQKILAELGEKADLDSEADQIAMLMYLTGMDGWYWLSMGNHKTSRSQYSRSSLYCKDDYRFFDFDSTGNSYASLCMIACQ